MDGINWDDAADRMPDVWVDADGNGLPLNSKLFLGPSFGPETGNIADASKRNRLFLYQVRFNAIEVPILRLADVNPCGLALYVDDAPSGVSVNAATVKLTVDGA